METFFFTERIERFLRLKRRFFAVRGASLAAGACLVAAGVLIWLDVRVGLPPPLRWSALAVLALGGAAILWRCALHPARTLTPHRAVVEIERAHAEIGQRLRTSYQVSGRKPDDAGGISPSLADALLEDTRTRSAAIQPEALIPWRTLRPRLVIASLAMVLLCAGLLLWPDFRTGLLRLFMPGAGWTFTRVTARSSADAVPTDASVTIEGLISGRPAAEASLHLKEEGGEWSDTPMEPAGDGMVRAVWKSGDTSCTYYITAGDGQSDVGSILVHIPPAIEGVTVRLVFPAYTRLQPRQQDGGDVEAVEGTEAHVTVTLNHPVTWARIRTSTGETRQPEIVGQEVRTRFELTAGDVDYHLEARDANGLELPRIDYLLRGIEDKVPEVTILVPDADLEVTRITEVPIRFHAKDDFGIEEIAVLMKVKGDEKELLRWAPPTTQASSTPASPISPLTSPLRRRGAGPHRVGGRVDHLHESTLSAQLSRLKPQKRTVPNEVVRSVEEAATAFLERHPLTFTDNVQYYVYARDGKPGRTERGISDLRSIDIRPFRLEYRLVAGAGGGG